jgi:hypothetical protein
MVQAFIKNRVVIIGLDSTFHHSGDYRTTEDCCMVRMRHARISSAVRALPHRILRTILRQLSGLD